MAGSKKFAFTHLSTDPNAASQPAEQLPENGQGNSQNTTPSSLSSCTDPPSAYLSLQAANGSQLSDLPSGGPHADGSSTANGSASESGPQGSSIAGEEEETTKVKEFKEATNSKKHLHCPTCKVTVNSSSQLESHCSGIHYHCCSF